jgi:hypothetical protein
MRASLSIVFLVGFAAHVHADPPRPLQLSVSGAIDARQLATTIAVEVGRPIERVDDTCMAPCLRVAIAHTDATVTYTDETGAVLSRTIALGDDPAQWPTLVTLLAGNLVRDEAADVLGMLPPPPPPPLSSAPPPSFAPPRFRDEPARPSLAIGLVPGLSSDLLDVDRSHAVSIGAVAGVSHDVRGVAISGAIDIASGRVEGSQIAGALAIAHDLDGVQVAGALAIAGRSTGIQVAGALDVAHDAGVQIAGALDIAHDAGVQVAGALNIADHVRGMQIAPINVAHRVDGVQVGVINIGGGPDDESFGIINIVPGGRTDLEATVDADSTGALLFRHGGRHWHNVYGIAGQRAAATAAGTNDDVWMAGFGFGPSFHVAQLPADLEAIAWHVGHGASWDGGLSILSQLRLTVAVPLGGLSLVAGGAINVYVTDDHGSPLVIARTAGSMTASDVLTRIWPTVFVGARI